MISQLRAHTAVPEDLSSVPSTLVGWLTVTVGTCILLPSHTPRLMCMKLETTTNKSLKRKPKA